LSALGINVRQWVQERLPKWMRLPGRSGVVARDGTWLLVGLGNPGATYKGTRHNVGFEVIDVLATMESVTVRTKDNKALVGSGEIAGTPVLLTKPQTYMNRSGASVAALMRAYRVPMERVVVVHDDMDVPIATLKLKKSGGHGGHNGLRSLIDVCKTKSFARLKVGVGRPAEGVPVHVHVLTPFDQEDRDKVDDVVADAAGVLVKVVTTGLDRAMNVANNRAK